MAKLRMPRPWAAVLLLAWGAAAAAADADGLLWLSDRAPKRAKAPVEAGLERHGKSEGNMDAVVADMDGDGLHGSVKRVWLRQGADLATAAHVAAAEGAELQLLDAHGERSTVALSSVGGAAQARCEFDSLGFRNGYLSWQSVRDGVLRVQLAKAELLKGSCCLKEGDVDPAQHQAIRDPEQPLEIVREHKDDEKLFTRIVSGDKIRFTIYRRGAPLPGARVTLLTQQGWQKTVTADGDGRAEFTMIRDYFPSWSDFKRLTRETFVVVAEAEEKSAGSHDGRPYTKVAYEATLSGKYAVSPYDYKSYAWGLGLSVAVLAFGGLAVYLYRRRRSRPFREVRFSESA